MRVFLKMALASLFFAILASCSLFGPVVTELLTDEPQMALYASMFNLSQSRYKVNVVYDKNTAETLINSRKKPGLVIGKFIKNSQSRSIYQALDQLFSELIINQSAFYPKLLELGSTDGRQLLLPIAFNLPMIIFDKSMEEKIPDNFVLDISLMEKLGAEFNKQNKNAFTAMGFGPHWSANFIYSILELLDAGFREGSPLKWNSVAIENSLSYLRNWSEKSNASIAKEEEFQFKYLYLPVYKSVGEKRIAFAYMSSSAFFTLAEEHRSALSYRWLSKDMKIPVEEGIIFAGICRKGKGRQAAEAFLTWFYSEESQRLILEDARSYRAMESFFGVAGGFSALKSVNEKLFPVYYPSLLGKLPPLQYLKMPNALPSRWADMKSSVILPFLLDATSSNPPKNLNATLEDRVQLWQKKNSVD